MRESQAIGLLGFRTGARVVLFDMQSRQSVARSGRLDIRKRLWSCGCKLGITGALSSHKVWQGGRLLESCCKRVESWLLSVN